MKVALVTGTSTGIGFVTALHLARNGYKTFASMRDLSRGEALKQQALEAKLPLELLTIDVCDGASMVAGVNRVNAAEGRIDLLVNNAGVSQPGPIEFMEEAELRTTMETNFFGATRLMQLVLPGMRERGAGTIVNISSLAGFFANPIQGAYCASKFALESMTEVLAAEVQQYGVRLALIEPGAVLTPIFEGLEEPPELPPDAPYRRNIERLFELFKHCLAQPSSMQDVAEQVLHAATTDQPRLRYVVGRDAIQIRRMLDGLSSDEKLELMGGTDDVEYWRRMRELLPFMRAI